jgi:hypothetical protein
LRHGKSRWKTLLIFNDAIHVQVEGGGEDSNVEGINTLKVNDYLCVVHDVW